MKSLQAELADLEHVSTEAVEEANTRADRAEKDLADALKAKGDTSAAEQQLRDELTTARAEAQKAKDEAKQQANKLAAAEKAATEAAEQHKKALEAVRFVNSL